MYKPDDFVEIPGSYGYQDLDQLVEHGLAPDMDEKRANTFIQEWLFFSLLSRVLDEDIDASEFRSPQTHTVHTSDRILERKIRDWTHREVEASKSACAYAQARYIRATDALALARTFMIKHLSHASQNADDGRPERDWDLDDAFSNRANETHDAIHITVTLSIAILGEVLQTQQPVFFGIPISDQDTFCDDPRSLSTRWGYSKYCRDVMHTNNMCPSEIRRLESTMPGVCEVYYACSIKPARPKVDHSACAWDRCEAPPMEPLGHVAGECSGNCGSDLWLDDDEIVQCIKQSKAPLVTYDRPNGRLVLHQVDLDQDPPIFGALSHAWEDMILGIGSDARGGNSRRILQCRANKMQQDFNKLVYGSQHTPQDKYVPFYVDVLCYPRQGAAQAMGLEQMRQIYSKASEVLVWDRALLETRKLSDSRMIEMNVRIRLGNWTKSLWTLLEAVLARKIAVALLDETITFEELGMARDEARDDPAHEYHHVYHAGQPFSLAVNALRNVDGPDCNKFRPQKVWDAVQFQKIDKIEYEAPILAALMRLSAHNLHLVAELTEPAAVKSSGERPNSHDRRSRLAARRMVKLLELMNQTPGLGIPAGVIFLPAPRLRDGDVPETRQYGWAPRSWLTRQAHPRSLEDPLRTVATTHTNGLLVKFPGLLLHCPEMPLEFNRFWVPVAQSMHKWFKVIAYLEKAEDRANFRRWWQEVSRECELVIIMAKANPRAQGTIGLLVRQKGLLSDGKIRWVDILCRVWVRLETDREHIRSLCNSFRKYPQRAMFGTRTEAQEWCVDGIP